MWKVTGECKSTTWKADDLIVYDSKTAKLGLVSQFKVNIAV